MKIKLEQFETTDECTLKKSQINEIKEYVDYQVKEINNLISGGQDRYSNYVNTHIERLSNMNYFCSLIGIRFYTMFN